MMGATSETSKCSSLSLSLSVASVESGLDGSVGLLVSATGLSGVELAGSFLLFSFFAAVGFELSVGVSCVCCATVNGIVNMAQRRAANIFMLISGRKDLEEHYSVFAKRTWQPVLAS